MAVILEGSTRSDQASATTFTISYTVNTNGRRAMLVTVIPSDSAAGISTVAWNATESLTQLGSTANASVGLMAIWGVANPTSGTHNVTITTTTSQVPTVIISDYSGASQTSPFGTAVADNYSASGTAHAHDTTGQSNGMVVDHFALASGGGTITVNGGQSTQLAQATYTGVTNILTSAPGGTTVNTGYSWPNDFWRWIHVTVCVNPDVSLPFTKRVQQTTALRRASYY